MDRAENGYALLLINGVIINKYKDECDQGMAYIDFMTPDYFLYITPSSLTNTHNDSGMDWFADKGDSIF